MPTSTGALARSAYVVVETRKSDYLFIAGRCEAVRSRDYGIWLNSHPAVGHQLLAHVTPDGEYQEFSEWAPTPEVGQRVLLSNDLLTSAATAVSVYTGAPLAHSQLARLSKRGLQARTRTPHNGRPQ